MIQGGKHTEKKPLFEKWFAVGIILLFIGTCIIPATVTKTEKPSLPALRESWLYVDDSNQGNYLQNQETPINNQCYGFLINITENQPYGTQLNITRLLNVLLNNNVSIYWIACDITLSVQNMEEGSRVENHTFQKGCFIVVFSHDVVMNIKSIALIYQKWLTSQLSIYKIMQPSENFSAYLLCEPRIACYNCSSAYYGIYLDRLREAEFIHVDVLTAQQTICNLTPDNYNVFVWGGQHGSNAEVINDTLSITGLHVKQHIREFVEAGGNYIGSCYGGWKGASGYQRPWGYPLDLLYSNLLNLVPLQLKLLKYNVYRALPGGGRITIAIQNLTHPLAFGLPDHLNNLLYLAGPLFISRQAMASEKEIIGVLSDVNSTHWGYNYEMDFVPFWNSKILSTTIKYRMAHHWMNDSIGATMWIDGIFGEGKVIVFGMHPENTYAWDGHEEYHPSPRIIYNTIWYSTAEGPFTFVLELPVTFSTITVDAGGPYIAKPHQPMQVHGSALTGESPFNWYWEYGLTDHEYHYVHPYNNTREGQDPWFSFSTSGTYRIALVVTDASGNIGYDITMVTVKP